MSCRKKSRPQNVSFISMELASHRSNGRTEAKVINLISEDMKSVILLFCFSCKRMLRECNDYFYHFMKTVVVIQTWDEVRNLHMSCDKLIWTTAILWKCLDIFYITYWIICMHVVFSKFLHKQGLKSKKNNQH